MELPNSAAVGSPTKRIGTAISIGDTVHRVSYMALSVLFLAQLVAILHNHSHLGGMSMFDTVLLLIVKMDTVHLHKWIFPGKNVSKSDISPFLLIVACTVFEALIFVNFSHAIEAITCADSSSHFSVPFLVTVGLNVIVKSPLLFLSNKMSVPDISAWRRFFLHFGAPLATVSLALTNYYFSPETGDFVSFFDRYLCAGMCVLLSFVVLPLFKQNLPFLLCDVPKGTKEEQLKAEIEQNFPNLRLKHLHIYSKWPGHKFDVFMHVSINNTVCSSHAVPNVRTITEEWLRQLMHALQILLRTKGARRVTVQPWLAVPGEQQTKQQQWEQKQNEKRHNIEGEGEKFTMCVSEKCMWEEKSCCSRKEDDGEEKCEKP